MLLRVRRSLTLVELIVTIVVFGLAIPVLLVSLSEVTQKLAHAELVFSATILGRGLLEEIISKRFDENTIPPWSSNLGYESLTYGLDGSSWENSSNYGNWDDIDDFNGFTQNNISGFNGFSRSVTVYYVEPDNSNLDTPQSTPTNYKRVDVVVSHSLLGNMYFSVILSSEF
ncbi:MAG: hypothetical protein NC822_05850 [Candidatus Omnitrophica bacterium]|nr:hypothetical protein [Candidatus Omnitrophota bacterium]MCM8826416.1 hypothetical protein [Candidatus Omnitrophota bacterium]